MGTDFGGTYAFCSVLRDGSESTHGCEWLRCRLTFAGNRCDWYGGYVLDPFQTAFFARESAVEDTACKSLAYGLRTVICGFFLDSGGLVGVLCEGKFDIDRSGVVS